jgi:hypothetical protein
MSNSLLKLFTAYNKGSITVIQAIHCYLHILKEEGPYADQEFLTFSNHMTALMELLSLEFSNTEKLMIDAGFGGDAKAWMKAGHRPSFFDMTKKQYEDSIK